MTETSSKDPGGRSNKAIFELIGDPKATQTLPSLGVIVHELSEMMGKAHTPLHGISSLIRRDQSMSVRILRLANSAYFAPAQPIVNVEEALLYLGLNQVRSSILTARCIENTCNVSDELISWHDFWVHSVAVGCVARILAAKLRQPGHNAETYYIMGLMHDIGKLVLAYLSPQDFEKVLTKALAEGRDTSPIEFEMLGVDHAGLGAWYLQQQGLPSNVSEPIRLHHSWQTEAEEPTVACVLSLADKYAHFLKLGQSGSVYPEETHPFETPEWETYVEGCVMGEKGKDRLEAYVDSEAEQLHVLVDHLVS